MSGICRVLGTGAEHVNEKGQDRVLLGLCAGDPNNEVLGADLAKESVRDVYLATNRAQGSSPRQSHQGLPSRPRR